MPKTTWWPEPSDRAACSCWASSTSSVTAPGGGAFAPAHRGRRRRPPLHHDLPVQDALERLDLFLAQRVEREVMGEEPLEPADDLAVAGVFQLRQLVPAEDAVGREQR